MKQSHFRQAALDHNHNRGLGEVVFATSPAALSLGLVAIFIAVLILAFAWWGEFTRKAHVEGFLIPDKGLIKSYTPTAGTVIDKQVSEGQAVKSGDVLIILSTERGSLQTTEVQATTIALLKQRRDSLQTELIAQVEIDELQSRTLQERITGLETELEKIDVALATQQQRLAAAEKSAKRFTKLESHRFVDATQVQRQMDAALDQRGRLQDLERSRLAVERELSALKLDRVSIKLKSKKNRAAIERKINIIEQELTEYESHRHIVITAPADGIVTTILVEQGQRANPNTPLLSLIPAGTVLEAQLLVPSRAIGFVSPTQDVALRYQAFPHQRFGHYKGQVKEISKTLITPTEANLPVSLQEPVYLVTVSLDEQAVNAYGRELPLQPGMLLEADIKLDRRTIIEWVFDPLYTLMKSA